MRNSLRALLSGAIDYAGLFPPAALAMTEAVANFARYAAGEHAWMLGRFVVPAARLAEFAAARERVQPKTPWPVTVLAGADFAEDVAAIRAFASRHADCVRVASVETRSLPHEMPPWPLFVELPPRMELDNALQWLRRAGAHAKIRTGGVEASAIPSHDQVAGFLVACRRAGVRFKATAGLHHALPGEYPLTDKPGCATATMHGFINLLLAAALADVMNESALRELLLDRDPSRFRFDEEAASWNRRTASVERLAEGRAFAMSFGSCSFEEPVEELRRLGWL